MNEKGESEVKKCPWCAEEIQDEAIKCKHCGEALRPQRRSLLQTEIGKGTDVGCVPGCIICVFTFFIIYYFATVNSTSGSGSSPRHSDAKPAAVKTSSAGKASARKDEELPPAVPPRIGHDGVLYLNGGSVTICLSEAAYEAWGDAAAKHDEYGGQELIQRGLVKQVPSLTKVRLLDASGVLSATMKIRVLSGALQGREAWVPSEWVRAVPDPD